MHCRKTVFRVYMTWYKLYWRWYALYRILYWTDWGVYRERISAIYRSSVVIPSPETLVSGNLHRPTALAVDFTGKQSASTCCVKCINKQEDISYGHNVHLCEYLSPGHQYTGNNTAYYVFRAAVSSQNFCNCVWYGKTVAKRWVY